MIVVGWGLLGPALASQPADAGSPGEITIPGKVTDARGTPVEGAQVMLYQVIAEEGGSGSRYRAVVEKTTGADGTFTLMVPQGGEPQKPNSGYVAARKKGLALGWDSWRAQVHARVDLVLAEAKDLAGEVVDENGQPVTGAEVRIMAAMTGNIPGRRYLASPAFLSATTDGGGRFIFADLPVGATFELTVEKPGRATVETLDRLLGTSDGFQFAPGQAGIKLVSPTEAGIEGVVQQADGQPVAGVQVMARATVRMGAILAPRSATSAADGTFRLGGLLAGSYMVVTTVPAGQTAEWIAQPVEVVLKAGETQRDLKLQLAKGAIIEVLVKDNAGQPIERANVSVYSTQYNQGSSGITDATGLARIRVAAGDYRFSGAFKQGYARQMTSEQVTIAQGETKRIETVLNSMPKVAGTVRDEAGQPLAGVKIVVLPGSLNEATSDAQGKFEMTWELMPFGSQATTSILVARDIARGLAEAMELGEQTGNLEVKLKPGVTVAGTVLDHEGKPLAGARARLLLFAQRWGAPLGRDELITGADGTFEIKAVPPDQQYRITALAKGYGNHDVQVNQLTSTDGRYHAGEFRLALANLSVTGVVVDANDKPVAGASVRAYGENQPDRLNMQDVQTDAAGKFTITGVSAGTLRLSADARGGVRRYGYVQTEGGATDVQIVVSDRPTSQLYAPRRPASLKGKPLPPMKDLGIDLPAGAAGKRLLVCFWDMGQRPSRNFVTQLAARAAALDEKGVMILAVQAAKVPEGDLRQWIEKNKIPFPAWTIAGDTDKTQFAWGVVSLPHLILTDAAHLVVAEGFAPSELDKQVETVAGR
jgi:protocatechuate 3,4-dioxygenase beta subunit